MNKADLSARVADLAGLTTQDAQRALDAAVEAIEDALASGDSVTFSGFGRFFVTHRTGRTGVNPRTGALIHVPSHRSPRFQAGTRLKARVRHND